jgi:hypothetical protein
MHLPLYLPRRHRRKLLFPPGLLALAGLLWLGCVAMGPWQGQLKPRYAIALTMPVRPIHHQSEYPTVRFEVPIPGQVCKSCHWHEGYFAGNDIADNAEQIRITQAVQSIAADTMHAGGVRVRFAPTAHYTNLVFLLNLMLEKGIRKYWIDITRAPTTFYAITDAYKPTYERMICFPNWGNDVIYSTPPVSFWANFENQIVSFWQLKWLQPLKQPEWRASVGLLAAIMALGSWRMVRHPHKA